MKIIEWWNLRRARMAAKKFGLDFKHRCVFDHQLRNYGRVKDNGIAEVRMVSGKVGLYRTIIESHCSGNTGQKNWRFEFQGYSNA